jgi:hypothetical protein
MFKSEFVIILSSRIVIFGFKDHDLVLAWDFYNVKRKFKGFRSFYRDTNVGVFSPKAHFKHCLFVL